MCPSKAHTGFEPVPLRERAVSRIQAPTDQRVRGAGNRRPQLLGMRASESAAATVPRSKQHVTAVVWGLTPAPERFVSTS